MIDKAIQIDRGIFSEGFVSAGQPKGDLTTGKVIITKYMRSLLEFPRFNC